MKIFVDFHCHTSASKDSNTSIEQLFQYGRRRGLNRIVITDHNTISGAKKAFSLDPGFFIIGEEIMTTKGEILAVYLQEEIPAGLTPQETLKIIKNQNAFASVSHPFDIRSGAWKVHDLLDILPLVDAIEIYNSRCFKRDANQIAERFSRLHQIAGTAGSDAHAAFELGNAYMELPEFNNSRELKKIINKGAVIGRQAPLWVHIFSRLARTKKRKSNYLT